MSDTSSAVTVLHGGIVFTSATTPTVSAIAIGEDRILGVGTTDEISRFVQPNTVQVDLEGQLVLPGFQDAHCHPAGGAMDQTHCDLADQPSTGAYVSLLQTWADSHPRKEWVVGVNFEHDRFGPEGPHRKDLDTVFPDVPVCVISRDFHSVWVNSRALQLAGITDACAPQAGGHIARDADGTPTGWLHEDAAMMVHRLLPDPGEVELENGMLAVQAELHRVGITAWQEANVGPNAALPDLHALYRRLDEKGLLTARVEGALWWDPNDGPEQIRRLLRMRREATGGRFTATTVKLMVDGVIEGRTAALLAPYADRSNGEETDYGASSFTPEQLNAATATLVEEGFNLHFHSIGDRAARECLDALELVAANSTRLGLRHNLAHLQLIHPDDLRRFAALDVTANVTPYWARSGEEIRNAAAALGEYRTAGQYPIQSLAEHGARIAFGSDWPVSTADPLEQIQAAVTRCDPRGSAANRAAFAPQERMSLVSAIAAQTAGAAYLNRFDGISGTLEAGKCADLVVLDRNILAVDPSEISTATVQATYVDGHTVFETPQWAGRA